ncbi:hypothetical protein DFH11DRAFT_1580085 [Phellopilus nigrolimitatus]|nr:hypothetical protein DFH11DRAFT_1580085 [Phellopilus nigrolimitatus]
MFAFNPAVNSARSAASLGSPTLKSAFAHAHSPSSSVSSRASSNSATVHATGASLPAGTTSAKSRRAPLVLTRMPSFSQNYAMITPPLQPASPGTPGGFNAPTPVSTPVSPGDVSVESYFRQAGIFVPKGFASSVPMMRVTVIQGPSAALSLQERRANARPLRLRLSKPRPAPPTKAPFPTPASEQSNNIYDGPARTLPHTPGVELAAMDRLELGLSILNFGSGTATPALETIKEA